MIRSFCAPGYNQPENWAMWVSQWAHMGFLRGVYSYEKYAAIQDLAYRFLTTAPKE